MCPRSLRLRCLVAAWLFPLVAPALHAQVGLEPTRAAHGMVASTDEIASRVGVDIMRNGGNAVDAAVAVGLALAVTHPAAGNLGGGGFMLIRFEDGSAVAIDYRETAPAAATRDMYLGSSGEVRERASLEGPLAVGTPGTVAGLALALEKHGRMKWADVVEPARKLAEEGFTVSRGLAASLRHAEILAKFPESRRIFHRGGDFYREGETFRQPELAATLARLQRAGPREFYEGETARLLVAEMNRGGGLITMEDLRAYRPVLRDPLRGSYRGHEILTMPPPSSGGIALLAMLNMLEGHDVASFGHGSSREAHLLIEVMRRAFADRAEYLGDPDFVKGPWAALASKKYALARAATIDPRRATPSGAVRHGDPAPFEGEQTTHYSVVDAAGIAVSNTYTLNTGYGCGVTVTGAGFLLNNEMDDFAAKPGVPNVYGLVQSERNAIAPGKRPLSSMTPTIVTRDGKLLLVIGSPGGPTIINTVLQVIVNVIDHGMNVRQAIESPRIHHQWLPDVVRVEPRGLVRDVEDALRAMGHALAPAESRGPIGDAQGILIDLRTGERTGACDPRGGAARPAGY